MKKLSIIVVMAVATFMSSCTAQGQSGNFKSDIDTLSYAIGFSRTDGLNDYLLAQGVDSTLMVDFLKGFNEGLDNVDNKKFNARRVGMEVAQRLISFLPGLNQSIFENDSTMELNRSLFVQGFVAAIAKKTELMDQVKAQAYSNQKMNELHERVLEKNYGDNRIAGEQFLADNKTKEGVMTTASGLQYKIVKEGKGEKPTANSQVKVHYRGTLIDGTTEFDSSYARNEPATFRVNQVIPGWTEALQLMPVGSKWIVYIPQELGYGSRGAGDDIKPYSALIFEVELLDIVK
ncbi:MAG: FKBP-type peptidyl-prolyl cis-trans isomerase [Bacteroidaceae bacterium]|nr:FKBP-type peptidyl-prolyl cis-trans isomerase [Bacteroidaceae bacterium]